MTHKEQSLLFPYLDPEDSRRNDLTKLVTYGLVRTSGQNKSRRYYISEDLAGK
jgi:hypothetical protein